jgi:hypothetical protein
VVVQVVIAPGAIRDLVRLGWLRDTDRTDAASGHVPGRQACQMGD